MKKKKKKKSKKKIIIKKTFLKFIMDFPSQINELPLPYWQEAPKCDFKSEYKVTNINNNKHKQNKNPVARKIF